MRPTSLSSRTLWIASWRDFTLPLRVFLDPVHPNRRGVGLLHEALRGALGFRPGNKMPLGVAGAGLESVQPGIGLGKLILERDDFLLHLRVVHVQVGPYLLSLLPLGELGFLVGVLLAKVKGFLYEPGLLGLEIGELLVLGFELAANFPEVPPASQMRDEFDDEKDGRQQRGRSEDQGYGVVHLMFPPSRSGRVSRTLSSAETRAGAISPDFG